MSSPEDFLSQYTQESRPQIDFAWNGKHAEEFQDANQEFRWQVVELCLAHPENAPLQLLEHLFQADADWAVEAWGAPHHFAELGTVLLERGQEAELLLFSSCFVRSFDTFGACHQIQLHKELISRLTAHASTLISGATDEGMLKPLEAVMELFSKMENGSATQGWMIVKPGTPVTNIRVVWPRWYHKLWQKFTSMLTSHAT